MGAKIFLAIPRRRTMSEPDKILRMRTVLQRTGLSRSTIYRKMKVGSFPNQVHISEHCCGWRESAINRWIADPPSYVEECALAGVQSRSGQRLLA
jgi:prophage regulatory protein